MYCVYCKCSELDVTTCVIVRFHYAPMTERWSIDMYRMIYVFWILVQCFSDD